MCSIHVLGYVVKTVHAAPQIYSDENGPTKHFKHRLRRTPLPCSSIQYLLLGLFWSYGPPFPVRSETLPTRKVDAAAFRLARSKTLSAKQKAIHQYDLLRISRLESLRMKR